jgi:hypothetical protein
MIEVPAEIKNTSLSNKSRRYSALLCGSSAYRETNDPLRYLARKVFEETFQEVSLNPELARKWVDLNTERLHALQLDMEAGGGRGHA